MTRDKTDTMSTSNPKVVVLKPVGHNSWPYNKINRKKATAEIQQHGCQATPKFLESGFIILICISAWQMSHALNIKALGDLPYKPYLSKKEFKENEKDGKQNKTNETKTKRARGVIYRVNKDITPESLKKHNKVVYAERMHNKLGQTTSSMLITFINDKIPENIIIGKQTYKVALFGVKPKENKISKENNKTITKSEQVTTNKNRGKKYTEIAKPSPGKNAQTTKTQNNERKPKLESKQTNTEQLENKTDVMALIG